MSECHLRSYIAGECVLPQLSKTTVDAVNPATEELIATIALFGPDDVDRAVGAARSITTEMGEPYDLAHHAKAECGPGHFGETIKGGARV